MATIAEFTIPAVAFPLGSVFEDHPGVTIELERLVPTNEAVIPYFWVQNVVESEESAIEAELRNHPAIKSVSNVDAVNGEYLKRVEWAPDYEGVLQAIAETDVALLSGTGTADEWTFELRAVEHEAIASFQQYCQEHDLPAELTGLHALSEMETGTEYNLTTEQREALILAYERGYYRSPRETTLEEIADELGITGQSLGSRLNRGTHRLVGSTLVGSNTT